ncbi:MAG: hypothetical protein K2M63_01395 [Muribaculaceae bacterium]|nr:hypothetical protein [Muribaculaceae bacterium]
MKRLIFLLIAIAGICFSAFSQVGLNIDRLLNSKYTSDPNVTETYISGDRNKFLRKHNLTAFLTFKGPADKYGKMAEGLIIADAAKAIGKDVRYKGGRLYCGLYTLKPATVKGRKVNRYLYYVNTGAVKGKHLMIVYLEGTLSEAEAHKLIRSMVRKVK